MLTLSNPMSTRSPRHIHRMCAAWARCRARGAPGVLSESMDQGHLIDAMDVVMRRMGGTSRQWRTDRLATVTCPAARCPGQLRPGGRVLGAIVAP